jgi:hypothetical protein
LAATGQPPAKYPAAAFDGPPASQAANEIPGRPNSHALSRQDCPSGLIAVGISGRSGILLDALGLICGPPKLTRTSR